MKSLEEWLTRPEGLGTRLREVRAQAGLSGKQLAEVTGWDQSKVSRIETGKRMPTDGDIRTWAAVCAPGDDRLAGELLGELGESRVYATAFRSRMAAGQAVVQKTYNDLVRESDVIRHFETVFVPGLLQVEGYARRIFTEMVRLHELEVEDVDAAITVRMARQQYLWDPSKRFEFLLAEPVLRFWLAEPPVMRAQLDRLQTVIGLKRIRFGVIPMHRVLAWTPQASVQVYEGSETVAVTEDFAGETWHRENAAAYARGLDLMWEEAVEGEPARELIIRAVGDLPR